MNIGNNQQKSKANISCGLLKIYEFLTIITSKSYLR